MRHDSNGLYAGLPQNLPVTRYHSLAGTHPTLPECLEVSSWSTKGEDASTEIIMGVRHKEYVVEGVQFHPESILTAEGRSMLRTFLEMRGGTWAENARLRQSREKLPNGKPANNNNNRSEYDTIKHASTSVRPKLSILEEIFTHRKQVIRDQMEIPSRRFNDLQSSYDLGIAPPQVSFLDRLKQSSYPLSLMAEIKRASPSKGLISLTACAPTQARTYALAGASVISVLTEPQWFKGSIDDLRATRQALEGFANRPAILRKDFIFDEYQILEARLAGADTVLLIVKMLDEATLFKLYEYSLSLGMEPLVEVNNAEEMSIAVKLKAKVIGVNNRNLRSFEVDLDTTSRLLGQVPQGTVVCALSGISSATDVENYKNNGVGAVLVGEALMRAAEPVAFIRELLGTSETSSTHQRSEPLLVKICGTRTVDAAKIAIDAGADMIGMILVPGRSRFVADEVAIEISNVVHQARKPRSDEMRQATIAASNSAQDCFELATLYLRHSRRPLLVGVFQNQPLSHILHQQKLLDLDVVQLHGSEPIEWAKLIPVPVIRRFSPEDRGISTRGYHAVPLLDSAAGGVGQKLNSAQVISALEKDGGLRAVLAGGLTATNLKDAITELGKMGERIVAVDVSSGVEEDGKQDSEKIRAFVKAAREIR